LARPKPTKVGNPEPITIGGIITALIEALASLVSAMVMDLLFKIIVIGKNLIGGISAMATMSAFHGMVTIAPDFAKSWFKKAVELYYMKDEEWVSFVEEYMSQLTGKEVSYAELIEKGIGGGGAQVAEDLGEAFLHPMLNLIMPGAEGPVREAGITPQDGLDAAERFLGVNLRFQMQAWLLHMIGDVMSFGMWKALKDLPNAISWSYGIGWLSWLVMGGPFKIAIADPLVEYYNRMYRPARLGLAKAADAANMGLISKDEVVDLLRGMGWSEELIPVVLEMEQTKLGKAEAELLYRHGFLTFEQYVATYRTRGYTPEEALALATIEAGGSPKEIIKKIADEAFDLYVDGIMDEPTVRQYLEAAYNTPEEVNLWLALAELKRLKPPSAMATERKLSAANIGNLYKKGKKTPHEAIIMWLDANVPEYQINDWLLLYEPDKPPEPTERELATQDVGILYKQSEMDADEASALWTRLEWKQSEIDSLFRYYRRLD